MNGITFHWNMPMLQTKVILWRSLGYTGIKWKAKSMSNLTYSGFPVARERSLGVKGNGSEEMMKEFGIGSPTTITLGMTMYMLGLVTGLLILAPMSGLYGRRPVYLIPLFLLFILVLPAWHIRRKSKNPSVPLLLSSPNEPPVLSPIIGSFVYQNLACCCKTWLVFIFGAIFWFLGIFCPKTYAPVLFRKRAEKLRNETSDERYMIRFCYKDGEVEWELLIKTNV
ncbi:hypothetical protein RUND412_010580 [Rhizina undulata]